MTITSTRPSPATTVPGPGRRRVISALSAICLACAGAASQAGVVEYADVAGFRTFQDTGTGRVWVDLDSRYSALSPGQYSATSPYANFGDYKSALETAGFTWATTTDVQQLLDTLTIPVNATAPAVADGYRAVMMSYWGGEFGSLWGIAEDSSTPTGQVLHGLSSSGGWPVWGTMASSQDFSATPTNSQGLWAYMAAPGSGGNQNAVPEPGSMALLGVALAAMAVLRRHGAGRPAHPAR